MNDKEKPITFECVICGKPMIERAHAVFVLIEGAYYPYCAECNCDRLKVKEVLNASGKGS